MIVDTVSGIVGSIQGADRKRYDTIVQILTKPKPHLRRESGYWLCTANRLERHIMRGFLGSTPMQAYQNFTFHQHLDQVKFFWSASVGKPA